MYIGKYNKKVLSGSTGITMIRHTMCALTIVLPDDVLDVFDSLYDHIPERSITDYFETTYVHDIRAAAYEGLSNRDSRRYNGISTHLSSEVPHGPTTLMRDDITHFIYLLTEVIPAFIVFLLKHERNMQMSNVYSNKVREEI